MGEMLTLRVLRASGIEKAMQALQFQELPNSQKLPLLKMAVLFLNNEDQDIRDFGYRIVLKLALQSTNFLPLYDVAAGLGYTPINNLIKNSELISESNGFISTFMEAYRDNFKLGETFQTEQQHGLFNRFRESSDQSVAVVAPTSYGKSQLIEETIKSNINQNIAIIVPSKALISQTRSRVVAALGEKKRQVISHHDMRFDATKPIIAVVTQERMLRIYQKHDQISFDTLFIDEAHNLLSEDKRARLLASCIIISKIRNPGIAIKYLTPFLISSESLTLTTHPHKIKEIKLTERIKTEDYYLCDFNDSKELKLYDHFLNKFFDVPDKSYPTYFDLLEAESKRKNIVYLNRPKDIEDFCERLAKREEYKEDTELEAICNEIIEFVHPKYRLVNCLRKGVVYHHGSVPDVVRTFIESAFKQSSSVRWITTNSTLLEGVNIPAESLFILDNRKGNANLTPAQFRNLVGRVNRFSEIFDPDDGSPQLLVPQIFLVGCQYGKSTANLENFIEKSVKVDRKLKDDIKNPLLSGADESPEILQQRIEELAFIENIEPGNIDVPARLIAKYPIGKLCHLHNVYEFNIAKNEEYLNSKAEQYTATQKRIVTAQELVSAISEVFVKCIEAEALNNPLSRLHNEQAQHFYAMFFDWRINQVNYRYMISKFISYWKSIMENEPDEASIVYAGKWGNQKKQDGFQDHYIDLRSLDDYRMINLAIVRIKEEQDFVDNNLVKFLEILNDLGFIAIELYNNVKYGTNDFIQIAMIRGGLSHISASTIAQKYKKFIVHDSFGEVLLKKSIIREFIARKEKRLIRVEVETSGLLT